MNRSLPTRGPSQRQAFPLSALWHVLLFAWTAASCATGSRSPVGTLTPAERHFLTCQDSYLNGDLNAAEACCQELVSPGPPIASALRLCAQVAQGQEQTEIALLRATDALARDASPEAWQLFLSLAHQKKQRLEAEAEQAAWQGNFTQAAELLQERIRLEADDELNCRIGRWKRLAGDQPAAVAHLEQILSRNPEDTCALRELALVARERQDWDRTRKLSERLETLGEPPVLPPALDVSPEAIHAVEDASSISRSQLARFLLELFPPLPLEGHSLTPSLADVYEHPHQDAILQTVRLGWISPTKDGRFHPERPISRLELAILVQSLSRQFAPANRTSRPEGSNTDSSPQNGNSGRPLPAGLQAAFPEMQGLWSYSPFTEITEPNELLEPIRGGELITLVSRLWPSRWEQARSSSGGLFGGCRATATLD